MPRSRGPYPAELRTLDNMRQRCNNPNDRGYYLYGGRGIRVMFNSVEELIAEIGLKPTPEHSIDRYPDNNGHYAPGNVRWATRSEQQQNTRQGRDITIGNETLKLREWGARIGISRRSINSRLRKQGWCETCAVTLSRWQKCPHVNKENI